MITRLITKQLKNTLKHTIATSVCLISIGIGTSTYADADPMVHSYAGQKTHQLNFGGNGIDTLLVTPPKRCSALRFNSVKIHLTKKRYGKAHIIAKPKKGCQKNCVIKVKWAQKPAGVLAYNLHVTWEKLPATC